MDVEIIDQQSGRAAGQGPEGASQDVHLSDSRQHPCDAKSDTGPGQGGKRSGNGVPPGLDDGVEHQQQTMSDGCKAQNGQDRTGDGKRLGVVAIEELLEGPGQQTQSCSGGECDQTA